MDAQLYENYLEVLNAPSMEALRERAQKIVEAVGFHSYLYFYGRPGLEPEQYDVTTVTTYPEEWVARYIAGSYHLIDPTAIHVKSHYHPLPWRNALFGGPAAARMYAEAKRFGISAGASFPSVFSHNVTSGLGIARPGDADQALPDTLKMLPYGQLLANYLYEAMKRFMQTSPALPQTLTPREKECVWLAARSKTDVDIANLTGINVQTVRFHLRNARKKLGVTSRNELLAQAIALKVPGL